MLRKISSVENGSDGSLVNWENVYDMIDNLYSGFYSRLHNCHGNVLAEKEEQIIALMVAGFSTKEISVITGQSAATIYVRKSSVRKKLGVPEKKILWLFKAGSRGLRRIWSRVCAIKTLSLTGIDYQYIRMRLLRLLPLALRLV